MHMSGALILADTKFEFGLTAKRHRAGQTRVIDAGLFSLLAPAKDIASERRNLRSISNLCATIWRRWVGIISSRPRPELPGKNVGTQDARKKYEQALELLTGPRALGNFKNEFGRPADFDCSGSICGPLLS